jgi:hypothetical protein
MARTLERPTVHPEVHPDIHPDVHPDVDEFIRTTLDEHEAERVTRRPVRWMRWMAAAFLAIIGVGVAILALQGDEVEYAVPRTADGTERWLEYSAPTYAVPQTADGTERWLESVASRYAVPSTADGTVRWVVATTDFVVPRSADGRVLWFEYLTPAVPSTADGTVGWMIATRDFAVPRTADGAEAWILSSAAPTVPVQIVMRPVTQLPPSAAGYELTYLPVTPPTGMTPDQPIELVVQPVYRPIA